MQCKTASTVGDWQEMQLVFGALLQLCGRSSSFAASPEVTTLTKHNASRTCGIVSVQSGGPYAGGGCHQKGGGGDGGGVGVPMGDWSPQVVAPRLPSEL